MKRIIILLLTITALQGYAQNLQGPVGYGKQESRFKALNFLGIPYKDTICDLVENSTNGNCNGAIVLNPADSFVYIRVPGYWKRIGSISRILASNGLHLDGDTVKLGGQLTGNSIINGKGYSFGLTLDSLNKFQVAADSVKINTSLQNIQLSAYPNNLSLDSILSTDQAGRVVQRRLLALDSAYMRNDTMFFPVTTGGELAIKITGLPQANVIGLVDSLLRRPDTTQVILNQTKYAQPASFWIAKFGRIDSSLIVRRNVTGQVLPIVDVQNSGAFGGGIQLGNGTSSVSSFLPSIKGLVQRDTTQAEEFRSTIISSNYYSADTAGKSFSLRNTLPASGGLLIGSTNQTSPTLTVALHDNIFGVFTTVKNVDTDSATRTMRQTYSLRLGGDHNMQMKGRLAVGYPFVDTLGKQDQLIAYLQKFPSGVAGMFNGKVVAKDGTADSNLVTYRQVNSVSVMQFGAKADGITNDSLAFAQAVATGAKRIYVPRGVYALSKVKLRDNIEVFGEPGTIIRQLPVTEYYQNGCMEYRDTVTKTVRRNVTIRNIEFECYPNSSNLLNYPVLFLVDSSCRIENIRIENLIFRKQVSSCIALLNRFQDYLGIKNVTINNCKVYGDTTIPALSNQVNLVRGFANYPLNFSYSRPYYSDVKITDCYAENVRTLADMKRGGRNIIISNNTARNLYDVAYSADGAFNITVANNLVDNDSTWIAGNAYVAMGACIEMQGERMNISNNTITYAKSNGILVSDYGYPEESGKGHSSRNVIVEGNVIRRADAVAIKSVNGINVMVSNNFINYAKTRSISMDSGDGYVDSLGNPLYARFNTVISNRISDTANIFIGADSSVVAKNFSTHGPASLNVSSSSTWVDPSNATDYLTLIKTVDGSGSGLDADLFDGRESNTFFSNSFTAFTDFNSATGNAVYDVSNFQPSNRPPSGNYFSLMNIDNSSANNNRFQMAWQLGTQNIYTRNQSGGTWSGWNTLYHNGNANLSTVSWSTSSIAISGAVSMPYTTISANTTLDGTHRTVSTSTSGITVTLPSASSATNRIYEIRNASAGNITISPVQVWGTTTTTIPTVTSWCIQSDGTNWILLSRSN